VSEGCGGSIPYVTISKAVHGRALARLRGNIVNIKLYTNGHDEVIKNGGL